MNADTQHVMNQLGMDSVITLPGEIRCKICYALNMWEAEIATRAVLLENSKTGEIKGAAVCEAHYRDLIS